MTLLSPTAAAAHAQDVLVLSTGDIRIPLHPALPPAPARGADQHYRAPAGDPGLRAVIAASASAPGAAALDAGQVLVAPGARQAILAVLRTVLTGGRTEVLVPSPYWASYPHLIEMAGGRAVTVPGEVGDASPDIEALEAHRTGRTGAVVVNSPRNPDGAVASAQSLRALVEWAGEHGITVLFDQVYRGVAVTDRPAPSITGLYPELPGHCVLVDGLSKSHALAGLRLGWAIASPATAAGAAAVASHFIGHTSGPAQDTAAAVLAGGEHERQRIGKELAANLDLALRALADIPGLSCRRPAGGIFLFPDIRGWLATAPEDARRAPARWLAEQHRVAVVDGAAFGAPGHLRLSFALPAEQLDTGLARLRRALLPADR
ncbi:pyridoxal phosphate-dependent aminotransferase [Kitasatospora sp. NPDC050543]|uniref:pyridoxal phosphate-dependent aminotransferase n=1 Tax=Kitasatospora sp. NPDC050543 TaxID=3364054 RepID=UPI0037A74C4A